MLQGTSTVSTWTWSPGATDWEMRNSVTQESGAQWGAAQTWASSVLHSLWHAACASCTFLCHSDSKEGRNDVLPVLLCGFRTELSLDTNVTPLGLRSPTVLKELVSNRLTRVTQGLGQQLEVSSGPGSKMGAGICLAYPGFLETKELIAG